jgi:hypothetical protein
MRLTKAFAFAVSTLALSTGAAFAGGDSLSHEGYQSYEQGGPELLSDAQPESMDSMDHEYFAQPQEYEVYEVYVVPADQIVLVPLEQPSEGQTSPDELG